jgi:outer membrane protein
MKRLLALSLTIIFSGSIFAQDTLIGPTPGQKVYTMNLQQCIDYAMQNSSTVQNSILDQQIAHRKVQEYLGTGFPQISGNGVVQDFLQIPTSFIPGQFFGAPDGTYIPIQFGTQYTATGTIQGSQLLASGSFFVGISAVKTFEELSVKNTQSTKIDLVEKVSKAYYTSLVAIENIKVINANLVQLKKLYDDTKAMYEQGFVEKVDMDRANVSYTNVLSEKEKAQNSIQLAFYLLKYQIGMDVNAYLKLTDSLQNIQVEEVLPVADSVDYNNLITYQLLQTQKSLNLLRLKDERMLGLPSLYLNASYSQNAQRTEFNFFETNQPWFPTSLIGIQLSVPIFSGFSHERRIQEDKLQIQENDNSLIDLQNAIKLQLRSAKATLANNYTTMDEQKKNTDLAESVFKTTKAKFDQGIGSNLEVTEAQTALEQAQTNYLNAVYNSLLAKVDLEKAMGTLYQGK